MKGHHRPLRAAILAAVVLWPLFTSLPAGDALARPAGQTTWCPSGWTCQDVGTPTSGSQTQSGTTWNVTAGGAFAGNYDWYHFLWQPLPASGMVSTVVKSIGDGGNLNGGAGVMIRPDSTDPQAPYYTAVARQRWAGGWQVQVLYRPNQGANEITLVSTGQVTLPIGLEVMRTGVTYTAYLSTGGTGAYTLIAGSKFMLTMPGRLRAGLVVASGSDPRTITVGLDGPSSQVALQDPTPIESCPSDWTCTTVDEANDPTPPSPEGESTYIEQSWATEGSGWGLAGAWGDGSDQFRYIYRPYTGGPFSAHVAQHINAGAPWDDVGLMIRQSTNGKSPYYMAAVETDTSGNMTNFAIRIWYRSTQGGGGGIVSTVRGLPTTPWLSITDNGGVFSTSYSLDGSSWQPVPNSTPARDPNHPWDGSGLAGMASMGHSETAGFGSVEIPGAGSPVVSHEVGSPSEAATPSCVGGAVDCDTGWLWDSEDDLSDDDNSDMPLTFDDSYVSGNAGQDGPLGFGWTNNYNMFLSVDSSGAITVHEEAGTSVTFSPSAGTYQAPPRVLAALTDNGDGTLTFTRKDQTSYVFSTPTQTTPGQLLRQINADGYTATLSYQGGRLSSVINAAGDSLSLSYDDTSSANVNHVTRITDSNNRTVRFGYDAAGDLTDIYDSGRADTGVGHTTLSYDAGHQLTSRIDPAGHETTYTYDTQGRVHQQTLVMATGNRTTQWDYTTNPDGSQQTTVTDPAGHVTVETYSNHELTAETDGFGTAQASTWRYSYDDSTRELTVSTDPLGHQWKQTWDGRGNLLRSIGPATAGNAATSNETTTYQYMPDGGLFTTGLTVTNPSGVATQYTFDQHGNPLSVSTPLSGTSQISSTTFIYGDPAHPGDVTQVVDPDGHATTATYDAAGHLTRASDQLGDAVTFAYDGAGRVVGTTSPRGNVSGANPALYTTSMTYDNAGDLLSVTDPLGNSTSYHFDADGHIVSMTDAQRQTATDTYNEANEITAVTKPDGSRVQSTFDADGMLLSQRTVSSGGSVLSTENYSYDALNRLSTLSYPNGSVTTYGYDAAGNPTSVLDPMGRSTLYTYDELGELTGITYHDAATPDVAYSYNSAGLRATMTDGTGTSSYSYDSLQRLIRTVNGGGQELNYTYDLAGNVTGITYPGSSPSAPLQVTRQYDAANRLTDVTDWLGNDTRFSYDADGNVTGELYPASTNGTAESLTYDATDELTRITAARSAGPRPFRWVFGYGRNALNRIASSSDRLAGLRHTYTYDTLSRLVQDQSSNRVSGSWSYDQAGNMVSATDGITGHSSALCYDANHFQLLSVRSGDCSGTEGRSFSYNAAGDRTLASNISSGATLQSYTYNQVDQLINFSASGTSASYAYDGDGLRTSKTVNGVQQSALWDSNGDEPVLVQDGTMRYISGPGDLPVEQIDGAGSVSYYIQDQLGSTRGLLDASGQIVATYDFGPFGTLQAHSGAVSTPFGFAGNYTDPESGLQYLHARYYDPSTAQFITVDPLFADTGDAYTYADGDPVNAIDPDGTCAVDAQREPQIWGPVKVGKCTAVITGIGYDKKGRPHYSLRIYKGGKQIYNYHIYYSSGKAPDTMTWRVEPSIHSRGASNRRYSGDKGSNADQQAAQASQRFASDVQKEIIGDCGKTDISKLLRRRTRQYPNGVIKFVFSSVYSAATGNDAVSGWCPVPHPLSCQ